MAHAISLSIKVDDNMWICNKYVIRDLLELVTTSVLALETTMVTQLIN